MPHWRALQHWRAPLSCAFALRLMRGCPKKCAFACVREFVFLRYLSGGRQEAVARAFSAVQRISIELFYRSYLSAPLFTLPSFQLSHRRIFAEILNELAAGRIRPQWDGRAAKAGAARGGFADRACAGSLQNSFTGTRLSGELKGLCERICRRNGPANKFAGYGYLNIPRDFISSSTLSGMNFLTRSGEYSDTCFMIVELV